MLFARVPNLEVARGAFDGTPTLHAALANALTVAAASHTGLCDRAEAFL